MGDFLKYFILVKLFPGVKDDAIMSVSSTLPYQLPSDYLEFLKLGNGGCGQIGEIYIDLYRFEELVLTNNQYGVDRYAPGLFIFGSDGGDEAFGFDYRTPHPHVVMIPFISMDWANAVHLADSFSQFIETLSTRGISLYG